MQSMIHTNEKVEREAVDRHNLNDRHMCDPGWLDRDAYSRSRKYYEDSIAAPAQLLWWQGWPSESVKDAVWQCKVIQSEKSWAKYYMDTYGKTEAEHNKAIAEIEKRRKEKWTGMDFNEKIRRGLI